MEDRPLYPIRWTIKEVLNWTSDYFRQKGILSARLDAEVLLAHCLGADRLHLYLNMDRPLTPAERGGFRELVRRRGRREPVALITGRKEFWSLLFRAVPGVLIPRPDTEILVEAVLEEIRHNPTPVVLEIGTGSGAIGVALAREKPGAVVVAVDIDPLAASTARLNARDAGVEGAMEFLAGDLLAALSHRARFDVICSNPPYIPSAEICSLEPEIACFEPLTALDGGPDGLDVIRRLIREAGHYLKPGGTIMLEIGDAQFDAVQELFASLGSFQEIRGRRDLSGRIRVVQGRAPS
jgi:release factor glutamine methyltransferase